MEIDRDKDLAQQLNVLVDRLCGLYTEEEAGYVMTIWAEERQYKLRKNIIPKQCGFLLRILPYRYHILMMRY